MTLASLKPRNRTCYFYSGTTFGSCTVMLPSWHWYAWSKLADTRIAFMSNRHDERNWEIYLINSDGKRVRRLTEHPQADGIPAWSPDGKKIAYVSYRGEPKPRGEIYVMNPDGTNPINLTQSPEIWEGVSSWSPGRKTDCF